jgi:MarR family transcriptional regulator, organic hydroperoxide resistance regulator
MVSLAVAEFADRVADSMMAISREFAKQQTGEFYKVKVTLPQLSILDLLHRNNELTMSDMARSMNVTTPAMTGVVDRLVRDGYCVRSYYPDDRRVIKIKLTAKGVKAIKNILEHRRQMITKIFSVLSNTEREEYLNILTRIQSGLRG